MPFQTLKFKLTGDLPLIMHNVRLANPSDPIAKEIKKIGSLRKKTDADFEEMAHLEFLGGLYMDGDGPCIPGECLEAAMIEGAKKVKQGQQAKAGIYASNASLIYKGPRKPEELWKAEGFQYVKAVRIGKSRIIRMRPIFQNWSAQAEIKFDDAVLDRGDVEQFMQKVATEVGLLDRRPRFGRFTAKLTD